MTGKQEKKRKMMKKERHNVIYVERVNADKASTVQLSR